MPTPTTYNFTQEVDYPSILTSSIQKSSIVTSLNSISTDGAGPTMQVSVVFNDALSAEDQTTLDSLMAAYTNTPPIPSTLQVIQILGADSVSICPFGSLFTAAPASSTTFDVAVTSKIYIKGGIMYASPGNVGDYISVQIVDKNNITGAGAGAVLATYVSNWYVIPQNTNMVEDVSLSSPIPAGLFLRFIYTNASQTVSSNVIVNIIAYQGTE